MKFCAIFLRIPASNGGYGLLNISSSISTSSPLIRALITSHQDARKSGPNCPHILPPPSGLLSTQQPESFLEV